MILDFAVITVKNGQNVWKLIGGVSNSDVRLSDARKPLAHTHTTTDITDFPNLALKQDRAEKDQSSGYAGLLGDKRLPGGEQRYGADAQTACEGNDARLSDARTPTGAASGDLGGTYPAPTVTGLQGGALATPIRAGFIQRDASNLTWVQTDDVATASDLVDVRSNFRRLLKWVVETFGEVPTQLDAEYELTTEEQD